MGAVAAAAAGVTRPCLLNAPSLRLSRKVDMGVAPPSNKQRLVVLDELASS